MPSFSSPFPIPFLLFFAAFCPFPLPVVGQICGDGQPGSDIGWSVYAPSGHCFQVITAPMTQPNGEAVCQKMGSHLAAVRDNGTHQFVGTLTRPSYDMAYQIKWPILRAFWLGLQRNSAGDGSGTYKCQWSDGSTSAPGDYGCPPKPNPRPGDTNDPSPVFPWAPGQPSGVPETCTHTYALYNGDPNQVYPDPPPSIWLNRWNDIACSATLMGAVCSKPCANADCTPSNGGGGEQNPPGDGDVSVQK